jgi:solute carrier family 1 (glial high affinity glutamate transporter), member 3
MNFLMNFKNFQRFFFHRISPIGVFFLIAAKILEMESLAVVIGQLSKYFMTVILGLFVHGFGTIAVIFFLVVRRLPYKYVLQMSQVLATAFGTGSSSATMPITINCLDNMGIDPRVTRFVVPVGATINMDGKKNNFSFNKGSFI